jgi:uncharacterized protein (TIGR00255 family)
MTGFATAEVLAAPFRLVWEIRSVNHRFLDLSLRLPEELRALEPEFREAAGAVVRRGKLDCTLKVMLVDASTRNLALVPDALHALRRLQDSVRAEFPDAAPLTIAEVLRWAGVLEEPEHEVALLAEPAKRCLDQAIAALQDTRRREGERIADLLEQRNEAILALMAGVKPLLEGAQARYREKLHERLKRIDVAAQPERLEQELVLLAQRLDVAEEVDRVASHVTEIRHVLGRSEPIGRRLDFLVQELNREANTLSSKALDEELTRVAVELKVLIEQMREQVQNLE